VTSSQWVLDASTNTIAMLGEDLLGYFRNRVPDTMEAEDLVNQTWLAAGRTFKGHCTLRHYLFSVGRRLVYERWRRLKRRPWSPYTPTQVHYDESEEEHEALPADVPDLAVDLSERAETYRLRTAVARIPAPFRIPVEMVLRGYGFVEIAELTGTNYNTVRSRFARGKEHLRSLLKRQESDWAVFASVSGDSDDQ
jgi:RNA polymerase sigma factor (sigma-70 family)